MAAPRGTISVSRAAGCWRDKMHDQNETPPIEESFMGWQINQAGQDILSPERPLRLATHLGQRAKAARTWIIARGIQVMCGSSASIDPAGVADIPLISAGLRLGWLRCLRFVGIRQIVSKSGLGYPFVCRIGDLSEHPFYHRRAYQKELELCAAWLRQGGEDAIVYDVGANDGFFSCQLAQMLGRGSARIYAFEAVPSTFAGLVTSVQRLHLQDNVYPVSAAVLDHLGPTRISYSQQNSLCAQVSPDGLNKRIGDMLAHAAGITLDKFHSSVGTLPSLLKIDVEGSEPAVLRGAQALLARSDRPALLFEYNPLTLAERGEEPSVFPQLLSGYRLYYVDDLERQKFPFGSPIGELKDIHWICNLFAVPIGGESESRFASALASAQSRIAV
jgi:FkbM family methyltransferase